MRILFFFWLLDIRFLSKRSRLVVPRLITSRAHACASVFLYTSYASPSSKMISCPGCTFVFCFVALSSSVLSWTTETSRARRKLQLSVILPGNRELDRVLINLKDTSGRFLPDGSRRWLRSDSGVVRTTLGPGRPCEIFAIREHLTPTFLFVIFYRMLYSSRMRRM